jgi:hypothetical protein
VALTVFCDESGFTGPNLFLDPQHYFVCASVAMPHEQAAQVVAKIRADYCLDASELKYEKLSKSDRGMSAVRWLLETYGPCTAIFYADKRYAAAGKFFEHTFEPVLRPMKELFYGIGFHRFVSNLLFFGSEAKNPSARQLIEDGQNLIRNKKPGDLKRLLREPLHLPDGDDPFTSISAFCWEYRNDIIHEIALMDADEVATTWSMDISDTSLLMLLLHWGQDGEELEVHCDDSKPLKASAERITDLATNYQAGLFRTSVLSARSPVKLSQPISFANSNGDVVGIQLADIVAGATRHMLLKPEDYASKEWKKLLPQRMVQGCIFADKEFVDVRKMEAIVNLQVLRELGERARRRLNPIDRMQERIGVFQQYAAQKSGRPHS